jgi:hypothetical protein
LGVGEDVFRARRMYAVRHIIQEARDKKKVEKKNELRDVVREGFK